MWIGLPSLVLRTDWRARRRTRTAELLRSRRGGFVAPLLTPDRPVIVIWEDNQDSAYRIWADVPSSSKVTAWRRRWAGVDSAARYLRASSLPLPSPSSR